MTEVYTFRAATMREALARIQHELGGDAVILQTKQVRKRGFLRSREEVEITAGMGFNTAGPLDVMQSDRHRSFDSRSETGLDLMRSPMSANEQIADLRRLSGGDAIPTKERSITERPHETASSSTAPLAKRLDSIESLLMQLGKASSGSGVADIPDHLFHLYARLLDVDVAESPARDLVQHVQKYATPQEQTDERFVQSLLRERIASQTRCSGPIQVTRGQRKTVALVGPTGVGKTTTLAKLAANFRLRDGVKLGLVTVDTYRVAAVEQLQTYADIIDLPMKVVTSPPEMRRAIAEMSDMDLVLIDTAGRSPRDDLKIQELKALLAAAEVDETHLVLSLVSNLRSLLMTAKMFSPVGVSSLILTKLDEAAGMGTLFSVAQQIQQPISYFTTGQDVPDDIEAADADRAARLVLGEDDVYGRTLA